MRSSTATAPGVPAVDEPPAPRACLPRRRDLAVRYGLPAVAAAVASAFWFRPGRQYAYGDLAPGDVMSLSHELGSLWNHQADGAGSPTYDIARLAEAALAHVGMLLGLGPAATQGLLYAAVFASCAAACSFLASVWLRSAWAAAFSGVAGIANAYVLTVLVGLPLPTLLRGETALLMGLVLRAARRTGPRGERMESRGRAALLFALATLPLSYLAVNPPSLLLVLAAVTLCTAFSGPLTGGSTRAALRLVASAVPWALLLNLWWIVPQALVLTGGQGGGAGQANVVTDVRGWALSHAYASLPEVARLQGHWEWYTPDRRPAYASWVGAVPWELLGWALPLLALAGVLLPPRHAAPGTRRALRWLGCCAVPLLLVLDMGIHPPLTAFGGWLYAHVPGLWLYREPVTKFGALLTLAYAVAAGACLERAGEAWRQRPPRVAGRTGTVLAGIAALGALAYPLPLWTGAFLDVPGRMVAVPADWYRTAAWIDRDPRPGKIVQLPLLPYYMAATTWGYDGVDTVPQQLVTRPVLRRMPGGYFEAAGGVKTLLAQVQADLVAGRAVEAAQVMRALGATYVVVRRDLAVTSAAPGLPGEAGAVEHGLEAQPLFRHALATPVADVWTLGAGSPQVTAVGEVRAGPFPGDVSTPGAAADEAAVQVGPGGRGRVTLRSGGAYRITRAGDGRTVYRIRRTGEGGLVLAEVPRVTVAGVALPVRPDVVVPAPVRGRAVALRVGGREFPVVDGGEVVVPGDGTAGQGSGAPGGVVAVAADGGTGPPALPPAPPPAAVRTLPAGPLDIARADPAPPGHALTFHSCGPPDAPTAQGPDGLLRLDVHASGRPACAWAPAGTGGPMRVSFDYRTPGDGPLPSVCVWLSGPRRCAETPRLGPADTWRHTEFTVPDDGYGDANLTLTLDPVHAFDARAEFRDVTVTGTGEETVDIAPVQPAPAAEPVVTWRDGAAGHAEFTLTVPPGEGRAVVTLTEGYAPGWALGGLPHGWRARHVEASGYANAWVLQGPSSAQGTRMALRADYRPQRWAGLAWRTSGAAGAVTVLAVVGSCVRPPRRSRHATTTVNTTR